MQLDKNVKSYLSTELHFVAEKMREEVEPFRRLYFFSAIYGGIGRAINWKWHRDLVTLHFATQRAYEQTMAMLENITSGREKAIRPSKAIFDSLTEIAKELADYVDEDADDKERLWDIVSSLAEVAYLSTGNGNYLYEKGVIRSKPQLSLTTES